MDSCGICSGTLCGGQAYMRFDSYTIFEALLAKTFRHAEHTRSSSLFVGVCVETWSGIVHSLFWAKPYVLSGELICLCTEGT